MMSRSILLLLVLLIITGSLFAQTPDTPAGKGSFLFAYYPKEGKKTPFFKGYKRHLEWHRKNNDPFAWYGWTVLTGDRIGMFIDGTFGITFRAFDHRVKPQEDLADFEKTTAPFANAVYRKGFEIRQELSTATLLEQRDPTRYIQATTFSLVVGKEPVFEEILLQVVSDLQTEDTPPKFTVYRKVIGGQLSSYLVMSHHNGFTDFGSGQAITSISYLIQHNFERSRAQKLLDLLSDCTRNVTSETWLFRPDLSYFPERD